MLSFYTVKSILSVCALEVLSFYVTLTFAEYWTRTKLPNFVMSQIMLLNPPLKIRFSVITDKTHTLSKERENRLLVSKMILHNEAQTFTRRNEKQRSSDRRGDFKYTYISDRFWISHIINQQRVFLDASLNISGGDICHKLIKSMNY